MRLILSPQPVPIWGSELHQSIRKELLDIGAKVISYNIDVKDYKKYLSNADYKRYNYFNYIKTIFHEKTLEHYIAAKLLSLTAKDVYIDIASAKSSTPDIYSRLFGCRSYRQDLIFPSGLHGDKIGGDASEMPVPDEFCSAMALHCSFEHFEGDADIRFIREASRVLKPGGRLCILPLYMFSKYAIQVNPSLLPPEGIEIDDDATICLRDDGYGSRQIRFYDVSKFEKRIINKLDGLNMEIYFIENEKAIDPSCSIKFAVLIEK